MTMLVSACYRTLGSDGRNETFSWSRPEDADIFGKGADDYVSLCMSIRLGVSERRDADNRKVSPRAIGLSGHRIAKNVCG